MGGSYFRNRNAKARGWLGQRRTSWLPQRGGEETPPTPRPCSTHSHLSAPHPGCLLHGDAQDLRGPDGADRPARLERRAAGAGERCQAERAAGFVHRGRRLSAVAGCQGWGRGWGSPPQLPQPGCSPPPPSRGRTRGALAAGCSLCPHGSALLPGQGIACGRGGGAQQGSPPSQPFSKGSAWIVSAARLCLREGLAVGQGCKWSDSAENGERAGCCQPSPGASSVLHHRAAARWLGTPAPTPGPDRAQAPCPCGRRTESFLWLLLGRSFCALGAPRP